METTLVLGVGNTLLTDDGAGVHAALELGGRTAGNEAIRVLDAGTLGFALLPEVQRCAALLVFDAARAGGPPGAVIVREGAAMDAFVRRSGRSVHDVGLSDLLDMARLGGCLPARRALVGIEPRTIGWGLECTPPVAAALPEAVARALAILRSWDAAGGRREIDHAA